MMDIAQLETVLLILGRDIYCEWGFDYKRLYWYTKNDLTSQPGV